MKHVNVLVVCCLIVSSLAFGTTDQSQRNPAAASDEGGISTGRYITGGILGTAIGFGIGQGVQGRYFPLGILFTLGEGAGLGMAIAGAHSTPSTDIFGNPTTHYSFNALGIAGLCLYSALHVWEVVDVWVTGNEQRERGQRNKLRSESKFMISPTVTQEGAPGMIAGLRF